LANRGAAFDDALSILRYRYFGSRSTLASVRNLFGVFGANIFGNDRIDGYSAGPPMFGTAWSSIDSDTTRVTLGWPGADNTNHFFSTQDLFDPNKTSALFVNRIQTAVAQTNSYDRST